MIGGAHASLARDYWAGRDHSDGWTPRSWCEHYWQDWQAPHRRLLADAVTTLAPTSVLELGCHCGPNLRLFRARFGPHVTLTGWDLNLEAVLFGAAHFARDPLVTLVHGSIEDALDARDARGPRGASVICACYALCYLDPDALRRVCARAWATASRGLVLMEPMVEPGRSSSIVDPAISEWAHDYEALFADLGVARAAMRRIDFAAVRGSHLNAVVTLDKERT